MGRGHDDQGERDHYFRVLVEFELNGREGDTMRQVRGPYSRKSDARRRLQGIHSRLRGRANILVSEIQSTGPIEWIGVGR